MICRLYGAGFYVLKRLCAGLKRHALPRVLVIENYKIYSFVSACR